MSIPQLPDRARVVIIGGGVIGCSVAYHLAHAGWKDIVLLERDRRTSGTTWHAAGLMVTFGSTSETSTRIRQYSCDLYERLEAETGQATGFRRTGFTRRDHLHAVARRSGPAAGRPDGDQAERSQVLGGRIRHRASPCRDLDAATYAGHRARPHRRCHRSVRAAQHPGTAVARAHGARDHHRHVERGVPVSRRSRDRYRVRAHPVHPHHVRRGARLRAVHPRRACP
ncbi:MAG: FAD-dependent oxidoreductase [Kofleriaceae bacterium]